ncbi:MAG: M4 family metallopeptidase [Propionibacteriaceae bacterium]
MTSSSPLPPVHGIIPPHILENIARNGTPAQQERALATLALDSNLRQSRLQSTGRRSSRARTVAPEANKTRHIHDAKQGTDLPGDLVRDEGADPTGDVTVDEAYDYMGATWDFYSAIFERNSWDDAGGDLIGTVHFDVDYNNAFWDGEQMVYGDGDGIIFNRFTISVDVIGHELTHGVTQAESGLVYENQSGALNESVSDVFGSLVKQYLASETADAADWLIGEGLFTEAVNGVALRSMSAPGTAYDDPVIGTDPQPAHMDDYVETTDDNGGVHINSGITNRAFYLFATALGGYAWERAGRVWYATCTDPDLPSDVTFQGFADLTAKHAGALFSQVEVDALVSAWSEVGIAVGGDNQGQDPGSPQLVVLNSNHELLVQQGGLDAEWTLAASDVRAFAVGRNRIAVLDSTRQLLVREGGPEAPWALAASDVQAFALDGVPAVTAPATPPEVPQD